MKRLILCLMLMFPRYVWADSIALQTSNGNAVTSSNPLPVTFGTGNQVISGTLTAASLQTTGIDERIYGTTYTTNYVDFNDNAIYPSVNGLVSLGYVGINNSAPGESLDVTGSFAVESAPNVDAFYVQAVTGNVGVNTTAPRAKLEVDGMIYSVSTDQVLYGYFGDDGVSKRLDIATYSAHPVGIETNKILRVAVSSDGTMDIGGFSRTDMPASVAGSIGVKGNVEIDSALYVDGSIYAGTSPGVNGTGAASCLCKTFKNGICIVIGTCS